MQNPKSKKQQAEVLMRVMCSSVLAGETPRLETHGDNNTTKTMSDRSFEYIKGGLKQFLVALMVRCYSDH